jgi:hypothetical protein
MPHTAHQPAQQPSPDARTEPLPPAMSPADRAAHEAASYVRGPRQLAAAGRLDLIGAGA